MRVPTHRLRAVVFLEKVPSRPMRAIAPLASHRQGKPWNNLQFLFRENKFILAEERNFSLSLFFSVFLSFSLFFSFFFSSFLLSSFFFSSFVFLNVSFFLSFYFFLPVCPRLNGNSGGPEHGAAGARRGYSRPPGRNFTPTPSTESFNQESFTRRRPRSWPNHSSRISALLWFFFFRNKHEAGFLLCFCCRPKPWGMPAAPRPALQRLPAFERKGGRFPFSTTAAGVVVGKIRQRVTKLAEGGC